VGVVAPGAFGDLLVFDGNPLDDITVLAGHGKRLLAIMKEGTFVKDELGE
jgi:imidazolonepropionase-like amidohydrolase